LREKLPKLSDVKLKDGMYIGPQIPETINDNLFEQLLTDSEKSTWLTSKAVCLNFLGNVKAESYIELVADLLIAYQTMRCNVSLKIHSLLSHFNFSTHNLVTVNDEHGESFLQGISSMEKSYAGKPSQNMLADYCCNFTEDVVLASYKRMTYKKKFKM
jgi:hypothetical protein